MGKLKKIIDAAKETNEMINKGFYKAHHKNGRNPEPRNTLYKRAAKKGTSALKKVGKFLGDQVQTSDNLHKIGQKAIQKENERKKSTK